MFFVGAHQVTTCDCARVRPDIQQPQRLAGLLRQRLPLPLRSSGGAGPTDVQDPLPVHVQQQGVRRADEPIEGERQVHDRVLQPLAGVQGDHLRCGGVGVEPADPVGGDLGAGVGPPAAQPLGQRGQPETLVQRRRIQRLADVPEIGQLSFAVHLRRAPWPAGPVR